MLNVHARLHKDILWLVLDRHPLNNLTVEMLEQLNKALRNACKRSSTLQLIVITGTGEQAFCAGLDLLDDTEANRVALRQAVESVCGAFEELRTLHIGTVALVKGSAFGGGCELAALCDTIIAREDAQFRLPAANATVFPCATAVALPSALGKETVDRLVKSGATLTAREAMRMRLAHQVLSTSRFLSDAEELLVMLASVAASARSR